MFRRARSLRAVDTARGDGVLYIVGGQHGLEDCAVMYFHVAAILAVERSSVDKSPVFRATQVLGKDALPGDKVPSGQKAEQLLDMDGVLHYHSGTSKVA